MTKAKSAKTSGTSARPPSELGALLQSAGLRKTAARIAVLQFLDRTTTPLSHGEIAGEMAVLGFDKATVYRNLVDLVDVSLASRTDLGDHVWRFEIRRDKKAHGVEHPHFVCISCGVVSCLPDSAVRLVGSRSVPRSIGSHAVEVQVKGECNACANG